MNARERLVEVLCIDHGHIDRPGALTCRTCNRRADAVLAVLPDLLTELAIAETMGQAIFAEVKKYPLPPPGLPDGSIGWGARPIDVGRAAGAAAAQTLTGDQP